MINETEAEEGRCACNRTFVRIAGPAWRRCPVCQHPWHDSAKPSLALLDDFPDWLRTDRLSSKNTAETYYWFVRATDRRLGDLFDRDLLTCTAQQLRDVFLSDNPQPAKRISYKAALSAFYAFASLKAARMDDPSAALPRTRKAPGLPRPLEPEELMSYMEAAERLGPKFHAFAGLGAYAGLRISEAAGLEWSLIGREIRVTGKGEKTRHVPVSERLGAILSSWRNLEVSERFVFPNGRGGPIASHSASTWHRRITAAGSSRTFNYHALRHTFATEALAASGGDLRTVQLLLGHSSPSTTAVYTRVASDRLFGVVARMFRDAVTDQPSKGR